MIAELVRSSQYGGCVGPLVVVILDGVGVGNGDESDAVRLARTPTLDSLRQPGRCCELFAHGCHVGLPSDADMGNSEVGHNALGSGQVFDQGAKLVDRAIESGAVYRGRHWPALVERCTESAGGALHFIGLLSDGNVHSHIDQLFALMRRAVQDGARRLYVHALLDGRDVPATSALVYAGALEVVLAELRQAGAQVAVASGGGRMRITMDRYQADWDMVARGWSHHVHGQGRTFKSLAQAVSVLREECPGIYDQDLPGFVIADDDGPVAPIEDGDSVVFFNYRGDRAIEITQAFERDDFPHFDRGRRPDVYYCGMMEYDGDTHTPSRYLVEPPEIERTMGEFLVRAKVSQLAIAETQKFGHVTYFWNGNRSGKFDDALETYIEIPSDRQPFQERPWMKAAEITDALIAALRPGDVRFARVNYANGDMVGHTGDLGATILAIEAIDLQLGRLRRVIDELGGVLLITADHGNADEMYFHDKDGNVIRDSRGQPKVRTSHSLNRVPFILHDPSGGPYDIDTDVADRASIASVATTCYQLLGFDAPEGLVPSLLRFR